MVTRSLQETAEPVSCLWAEELAYCRIACQNKVTAAGGGSLLSGYISPVCAEGQSTQARARDEVHGYLGLFV